ncbi:prostate and testis expressed protein 13-like [Ochotona princeps]|uniref:prostate and testis expressed protein 13-like n=1 Tax=Ochotona princeps TaxID=9978 RepID=UPI0027146D9B|nr:prostate and testis expressed protein 13-like [Ochotona princeps]
MSSNMFQLFLLGISVILFMGARVLTFEWVRFCNHCDHFNGARCLGGMKSCWKFNLYLTNKSCATNHYYYNDRYTGLYLFRYTTLTCKPCEAGMFQVFHDLLRETSCCSNGNRCNDGRDNHDISKLIKPVEQDYEQEAET